MHKYQITLNIIEIPTFVVVDIHLPTYLPTYIETAKSLKRDVKRVVSAINLVPRNTF